MCRTLESNISLFFFTSAKILHITLECRVVPWGCQNAMWSLICSVYLFPPYDISESYITELTSKLVRILNSECVFMMKTLNWYIIGKDMLIQLLTYTMRISTYWIRGTIFVCVYFKFPFERCLNTRRWIAYKFPNKDKIEFCIWTKTLAEFL